MLCEEVFAQRVALSPAQVAGLTPEQLGRALSFEVEPFSGTPVADSVTGFHRTGEGAFDVIELPRLDRDALLRAAAEAGGTLAGIAHPSTVPDEEALPEWLAGMLARLESGALPLIAPPAPAPSPHRFLITGVALEAAALLLLLTLGVWNAVQRKALDHRSAELNAASRELDAATREIGTLKTELGVLDNEQAQRERVTARRGALLALLNGLSASRDPDVVVRGIQAEGPSSLVVSGLSLEAGAVDEMSIVLTQSLRAAGWTALPRSKTGKRTLASGGPWEFSLTVTHDETALRQPVQLSQRGGD